VCSECALFDALPGIESPTLERPSWDAGLPLPLQIMGYLLVRSGLCPGTLSFGFPKPSSFLPLPFATCHFRSWGRFQFGKSLPKQEESAAHLQIMSPSWVGLACDSPLAFWSSLAFSDPGYSSSLGSRASCASSKSPLGIA